MITEDYVSFEIAKLLKEKGFDGCCIQLYNFEKQIERTTWPQTVKYDGVYMGKYGYILCPTLQMTMKWLREIYKLEVRSTYDYDKDSWWGNINPMFEETEKNSDSYQKALGFDYQGKSYEEACEAAIKYCLENLV